MEQKKASCLIYALEEELGKLLLQFPYYGSEAINKLAAKLFEIKARLNAGEAIRRADYQVIGILLQAYVSEMLPLLLDADYSGGLSTLEYHHLAAGIFELEIAFYEAGPHISGPTRVTHEEDEDSI